MDQNKKKVGEDRFVRYPFRSLTNYKSLHRKRAEKMGVLKEFVEAPTLTRARRIVFP